LPCWPPTLFSDQGLPDGEQVVTMRYLFFAIQAEAQEMSLGRAG
jgi:hypothetical protein